MAINNLGFNQDFPIYNANGTSFHNLVIHQSSVESTVMSLGDKISGDVYYKDNTLNVTMGEYIVFDGIKYVLVNPPTIVRNGMVSDNNGTNGMTKYSFVFYHPMYMVSNFPFSDVAVTSDEQRYLSKNKNFSWIGNLFDFIAKLNKNLEQTEWFVNHNISRYDNEGEETSEWQKASKMSDVLSFDKQFVSDALKVAYDTWEIPFIAIHQKKDYEKNLYRYSNDGENFTGVSPTELAQVPTTGRNLILKSNVLHSGSDYLLCSYDFGNLKIQEGQLVNITIHGTLGSDRNYFRVYNTTASCLIKTMTAATEIESHRTWSGNVNWTKIDSRGQEVANDKLLIYQYPSSGSSVSSIEWIKVEIGTTRTEYTVAPEEYLIGTIEGKYMGYKARTDQDKQVVWGFHSYIWTYNKPFGIVFGLPNQEILDSNGNPFVFRFGKGVGLKNNSRTPRNNKIVTRIVGYGSERNIPYGYPQIPWYGNPDWSYTINNDPNEPNSLPIYDGILGGQSVRLIKHPFTRTTLMPSLYSEILFDKVSPYLPNGTSNTYYDPTLDLIDFYEADNTYPNPIIADAPSVEIHQFEDIYPELGEAYIVDAVPYNQDDEYYTYAQWYTYLQGRITDMQNNNVEGWQMELVQTMFNVTCPYTPEDAEEDPTAAISAGHWEWNTGQATATLDVTIKGNFVYVKLVSSWYNEEHKIVQIHADPTPVWDDTMNDNGEYIQSYFEMTLPQLSFDLYACAAITEEMKINMRGGACKGCTFPVAVDWDDYKKNFYKDDGTFDPVIHTTEGDGHPRDGQKFPDSRQGQITIIVKKEIETFGTLMPNVYQQPKTGDAFVILGISLPQSYVEDAQWRLDEAMQEYMLENNVYYYDYPLTFDEHFLATHTDILAQMHNNSIVRFQYAGIEMALYIKQMNIKFGTKVLPEYEITLTDDVEIVLNKIGQVADDVSRMRVQVSELQKYYSENLIQEINSKLSRMVDDVCAGRITFQQGLDAIGAVIFHDKLQSPQFQEGLYRGSGWRVDNLGNAEFESLRIRSFLEVVELLVNRMQAQEGDTVFTDNDQIEKVDTITINNETQYVLTLKEKYQGYVTTQTEGNVIKGIINTLAANEAGIGQYSDNVVYFTSWMHVEETHSTPNSTLGANQIRVSLYGDNDVPSGKNYVPCELMTIARWGNTLDPNASGISAAEKARRQRLRSTFYISTSEGRIAKLIDVHSPILVDANYGTTLGELPDFVKQYSAVSSRLQEGRDYLYAQGVVVEDFIKITRQGNPIYEYVDCGEWVNGTSVTPSVGHGIYLFQEFNSITGQYETHEVWHNNAKWRVKMHQPVTIGGVSTYYEPSDINTTYWQKLEEAAQGTSYEIKWTDPFGVVSNIPCNADGRAKYKSGGGSATWITATLYKREGSNAPIASVVAGIDLHAYDVSGNEIQGFPRSVTNASNISLENYDAMDSSQRRYAVVFKDAQNNIIESSTIARNLDGEDGEDGQDGARGKTGRWIYYGKEFDETNTTDTFVVSDVQIPYFKTGNNSYHAFDYGVNGAYTMAQMYAIQPNFNNAPWSVMTNDFDYLITKAIFAPNATLGSFVINGDWMLSTNGKINGVAYNNGALYNGSPAYTWFDPQYPNESVNTAHSVNGIEWNGYNFVPNYAVDGLTGKTFQHDGYFDGTIKSANAEISGKVIANEGEIGPFTINNDGLKVGEAVNWKDATGNFAYLNKSVVRIGQYEGYAGHEIATLKVLFGKDSDPNESNPDNYCHSAMYIYRNMLSVANDSAYKPATTIISNNTGTGGINVAMRLQGALQVQSGGVLEQGKYILRASTSDVNSVDLTKGTTFVINYQLHTQVGNVDYSNVNNRNIYLPSLSEVQTQLGIASNTPFAISITISAHLNTYDFHICSPNGVFIYDNVGNILNNQGSWNYLNMSRFYVVRLILIYDGTNSSTSYYIQRAGAFT